MTAATYLAMLDATGPKDMQLQYSIKPKNPRL